jgi:hypothetical protein
MNIGSKLNIPFPYVEKFRSQVLVSVLFAIFIYVFLILFQPFGISDIIISKPLFVLGYAGITFFVSLFSFLLYPVINSNFDSNKWTVKKMFLFILSQILLIAIFNWLYTSTVGENIIRQHSLFKFILITFSVGIFPSLFFLLIAERILFSKKASDASKLSADFQKHGVGPGQIVISLGSDQNLLEVNLSDLICIQANGNYVDIYTLNNDSTKKRLVRSSLSKINEQLQAYPYFKQCHRSFIVNTQYLTRITGNARNFNLHLEFLDFSVPVSRNFPIKTIKR